MRFTILIGNIPAKLPSYPLFLPVHVFFFADYVLFRFVFVGCSFFDEIARIGNLDYVPNETDVLHARTKTTGISETKFRSGQLSIQ